MKMMIGCSCLISSLLFFQHCIFVTWSASHGNAGEYSPEKRDETPLEDFLEFERSRAPTDQKKRDKKGKESAVESSLSAAKSSTKGEFVSSIRLTSRRKEDLLRFYYSHRDIGAFDDSGRNWNEIITMWSKKYDFSLNDRIKSQALNLRERISDSVDPSEGGIKWTDKLNDELMRIYYTTETGDSSEHGERIHAEWVRMKYPGYEHITPELLLNRAKTMIRSVKGVSSRDPNKESVDILGKGCRVRWPKNVDNCLLNLWIETPINMNGRRETIFQEAVKQFPELRKFGMLRVYNHANWLFNVVTLDPVSSTALKKKAVETKQTHGFIVNGNINWKPEHDKFLERVRNAAGKYEGDTVEKRVYRIVVQKFPEIREARPSQVLSRAKYVKRKAQMRKKTKTSNQELMPETQVQYYHFIDDQRIPLIDRKIHDHHEWNASTSLQPGPGHQQPDSESSLKALNSEGQSPDTNLRLG